MTELDKLVEKKDVFLYLDGRIGELSAKRQKLVLSEKKGNREAIRQRMLGRILELKKLRFFMHQGTAALKRQSRLLWKYHPNNPKNQKVIK